MYHPTVVSAEPLRLELKTEFRIAHGNSMERTNALVGFEGSLGEAALPPYYPTTFADVESYVEAIDGELLQSLVRDSLIDAVRSLPPGPPPVRAALDMILHDLWGRSMGHPLYRLFGLNPDACPVSSFALSIPTSLDDHRDRIDALRDWPILKLKVGSGDLEFDEAIIRTAREIFDGTVCVDANAAWSVPEALRIIPRLANLDLIFLEQPVSLNEIDDWHLLKRMLPSSKLILIADESVQTKEDIIALAGAADGINLKLAKCGGLLEMREMIFLARSLDMLVMIGCMIESDLAITAASHVAPLADFLDLDGGEQLSNNPFRGTTLKNGTITLPKSPGIGAVDIRMTGRNAAGRDDTRRLTTSG